MDLTNQEFLETFFGYSLPARMGAKFVQSDEVPNVDVDWRDKGITNAVRNQGSCGSCWAFSAIGALESVLAIAGKGLNEYSEQELVDCSTSYGNEGCNGGWMDSAYDYILEHGISLRDKYGYVGRD